MAEIKWQRFLHWFFRQPPPCEHVWRPIIAVLHTWGNEKRPAKQCGICKEWRPLTQEQFYAQFGETFTAACLRASGGEWLHSK